MRWEVPLDIFSRAFNAVMGGAQEASVRRPGENSTKIYGTIVICYTSVDFNRDEA
jgi:hypothetical protein